MNEQGFSLRLFFKIQYLLKTEIVTKQIKYNFINLYRLFLFFSDMWLTSFS